ncbi:MAG: PilZ domain-containing protein [Candidatus Omnitrophica bacterium]|nr:PilZ domain-containing protein [Candidatus Omnitrophota bacterium]
MQEKRRFVRLQVPVLLEYPNPATWKTERSYTQDISEVGIRFPTPVQLTVGQEMALTLQLPFQDGVFHATGDVVWIREIARLGASQYEVGVRFKWMEETDRQRLSRFLQNFLTSRL